MSINFHRSSSKHITDNRYYKYLTLYDLDPYDEDIWSGYPHQKNPQYWSKQSVSRLYPYQWRMYKTWKHNRKTQYK